MNRLKSQKKLNKIIGAIVTDKKTRTAAAYLDHSIFFSIYFSSHIQYPSAPFHYEMFNITEREDIDLAVITAFRSSAKTTLFSNSYPLWAIIGKQQRKFIILFGQTQQKAQQNLRNIKLELETNELLKQDLGPFEEENGQWGAQALFIPRFNAKIMAASVEQSIRGIKHRQYRPDLLIIDDVEDLNSVKTKEGREKTWEWLTGDVIPAKSDDTKIIVVGNMLHEDCLLMRLKNKIAENKINGIYREYAILDQDGNPTWPGRFPDLESIEQERKKVMNEVSWHREYLLRIISSDEQVIKPAWIRYYDDFPSTSEYEYTAIGIDLAISQSSSADYTAMVAGRVYGRKKENRQLYIMPDVVNKRLTSLETLKQGMLLADTQAPIGQAKLLIEDIAYQKSIIEHFNSQGYSAEGVKVYRENKLARLTAASYWIESGRVLFPKHGAKDLIDQLVNFGVEKHDDLADAFSMLLLRVIQKHNKPQAMAGLMTPRL